MARSSDRRPGRPALPLGATLALLLLACGPAPVETVEPGVEPRTGTLSLKAPPAQALLPGSRLVLTGTGFQPKERGKTKIFFIGQSNTEGRSQALQEELPATYVSSTELLITVDQALLLKLAGGVLGPDSVGQVQGMLRLTLEQGTRGFERTVPVSFTLHSQLTPQLGMVGARAAYLEDELVLTGNNFLMPGEGTMIVRLSGTFSREIYVGQKTPPDGQFTPLASEHVLTPRSRTEAVLRMRARVFGIAPGTFFGTAQIESRHITDILKSTGTQEVQVSLLRTQLSNLSARKISRGQRIVGTGAGFLPLDPGGDTATIIRLQGNFTPRVPGVTIPPRPVDIAILAEVTDNQHVLFVPRPAINDSGELEGLGAVPGRFSGSVVPVVVYGAQQQEGFAMSCGVGTTCSIDIVPAKQVLYAKFLSNFTEGLRRFGLRAVEPEVRASALEVVRRTYASWNVEVRDSRPDDYDEFTTMEVGGPDPNGAGLFGLDNTEGKDTGNIRLDDYIGGFNATADVEGSFAFGGVFIESFLAFSPQYKGKKNMLATQRFDDVFAPFATELGGKPADRAELAGGARAALLQEAARVLGALVGNTMAHEFGHSLGMAAGNDGSHNSGDNDRELMDAGQYRTFSERAELDEYRERPAGFNELHQHYLDSILPLQ